MASTCPVLPTPLVIDDIDGHRAQLTTAFDHSPFRLQPLPVGLTQIRDRQIRSTRRHYRAGPLNKPLLLPYQHRCQHPPIYTAYTRWRRFCDGKPQAGVIIRNLNDGQPDELVKGVFIETLKKPCCRRPA